MLSKPPKSRIGHNQSSRLALLASSRGDGDTSRILAEATRRVLCETIDLSAADIGPFDYEFRNQGDDFLSIVQRMKNADTMLFATPVYWYAMSGQMKLFFDRWSDLISIQKPLGRALAGRRAACLSIGIGDELPEGFDVPFRDTFSYFDIEYLGIHYVRRSDDKDWWSEQLPTLQAFADHVWQSPPE